MQSLWQKFEHLLDDYKLKKKLLIIYICCVLIPLVVTDSVVLYIVVHSEQIENQHVMENDASAVQYSLSNIIERAAGTAKNIYMNEYVEKFPNTEYESELDYVVAYHTFMKNSLFDGSIGLDNMQITIYADNDTVVNGGVFCKLSSIRETEWYEYLQQSGQDSVLYFYYDDSKSPAVDAKRKLCFIRKMDFFGADSCEKVVRVEIDYSNLGRVLNNMNYESRVYICKDGKILLSNDGYSNVGQDFAVFEKYDEVGYEREISYYGAVCQLYILSGKKSVIESIRDNMPLILLLVLSNTVLPWIMMSQINRSIIMRMQELSRAFESVDKDRLMELKRVRGKDEIGSLMQNYNRMVRRTNELIQTVYKERLREQEMDIARQNAELLALHSQINPHFLFNALESIRMHSILKQEYETADMVEKLAIMERQNVDWGNDIVEIKREIEFVEAYLGLQKYRFGERLSYELDIDAACMELYIPKLTIVTFVENACVHGIESKTAPGWIFVRVFKEEQMLCIEIEDTGDGLDEEQLAALRQRMQEASIEKLKEKGRVGMLNAYLRLTMMTENKAQFVIESEKGAGTMVQIHIPLEKLSGNVV